MKSGYKILWTEFALKELEKIIEKITFSFYIEGSRRRISIYLKDNGITDYKHYFWTETQVSKIPDLLKVLKQIK